MKKPFFMLLILVFFLLELILSVNKYAGVMAYSLFVGLVLLNLEGRELSYGGKLLVLLIIIPVARICEIFLNFSFFWETIAFYSIVFFLAGFYVWKFKIWIGYPKVKPWILGWSIIVGFIIGYAGNAYFGLEKHPELLFFIPVIVLSEEVLFRGMIQNYAKKEYGSLTAIICTSLLFAIFSLGFGFMLAYFMLIVNLIICLMYDQTKNVWLGVPINLFVNLLMFVGI